MFGLLFFRLRFGGKNVWFVFFACVLAEKMFGLLFFRLRFGKKMSGLLFFV